MINIHSPNMSQTSRAQFNLSILRHTIQSEVWSTFRHNHTSSDPNSAFTIQQAINQWYSMDGNQTKLPSFRDSCQGPHCNDACPEMFVLGEPNSNSWLPSSKVMLVLVVVGVAVLCILMKVVFVVWMWRLEWKQQLYLWSLGNESYTADIETALQVCTTDTL